MGGPGNFLSGRIIMNWEITGALEDEIEHDFQQVVAKEPLIEGEL